MDSCAFIASLFLLAGCTSHSDVAWNKMSYVQDAKPTGDACDDDLMNCPVGHSHH